MKSSRSNYVAARLFGILALVVFGTGGCKSHETLRAERRTDGSGTGEGISRYGNAAIQIIKQD
ncbi:MAG TPA: hypothetical protein VK797_18620 [Tepidisphaeraceae bacterium]|jgi:hypothetical protein|nr:hypothetical protein [Tepidisphaeraceae bacterium]